MSLHVHLVDRGLKTVATFHEVGKDIGKVGVVLYRGDYYTFDRFEVPTEDQIHLFFSVTNIMEVKL